MAAVVPDRPHGRVRRIVVMGIGSVGNTILALPLLASLKQRYPDASIRVAFRHRSAGAPIVRASGIVDSIRFFRTRGRRLAALSDAVRTALWRPDIVIVPFQTRGLATDLMLRLTSGALVVGHASGETVSDARLHRIVPVEPGVHERDLYLSLAAAIGVPCRPEMPPLRFDSEASARLEQRFPRRHAGARGPIALHPLSSAGQSWKRWPAGHWRELVGRLLGCGEQVVLLGAPDEAEELDALLPASDFPIERFYASSSLDATAELLGSCRALICGDSGLMHLGALVDVALLVLAGPTDFRRSGPLSRRAQILSAELACAPCYGLGKEYAPLSCRDHACMAAIPPSRVIDALSLVEDDEAFRRSMLKEDRHVAYR